MRRYWKINTLFSRGINFVLILIFLCCMIITVKFFQYDKYSVYYYIAQSTKNLVIFSAYYYQTSKLYSPNTMIILLNGHKELKFSNVSIECVSSNEKNFLRSPAMLRRRNEAAFDCLWEFYIANCSTVESPSYFGLKNGKAVEINFEYPVEEKYPVIMCYPPMVYESRWQQIIFATEIYHYFGADLQVQYINSAMKEIVDILEVYQSKGWIRIEPFFYYDFSPSTVKSLGAHPMLELSFRNQPLAYTDCLMKYREAAEFVIISDVDDILFPKHGSYFNEFSLWRKMYPNAAAFMYYRTHAEIDVSDTFASFSLFSVIKSLKKFDSVLYGKSVLQTKISETAWIHSPGLNNETTAEIPIEQNTILHVQTKSPSSQSEVNVNNFQYSNSISKVDLEEASSEFNATFYDMMSFKSNLIYSDIIFDCYKKHAAAFKNNPRGIFQCLTPLGCNVPNIVKGFHCKVARRNFTTTAMNTKMIIHVPRSVYYWSTNIDGCNIFTSNKKPL